MVKSNPGAVPDSIKSVTITSQQLSNLPILQKGVSIVEANFVNGAAEPLGFEGHITLAEAAQLMKVLPFTELTRPDENHKSFYTTMVVGEKNMYLVVLYFA